MATVLEIPLLASQNQTFSIALAGITYQMAVTWRNAPNIGWVLDISDSNGNPLVQGVPLVTGADLMAQYATLGFPGQLIVQSDFDPDAVPTFDNLGSGSHLYFVQA